MSPSLPPLLPLLVLSFLIRIALSTWRALASMHARGCSLPGQQESFL